MTESDRGDNGPASTLDFRPTSLGSVQKDLDDPRPLLRRHRVSVSRAGNSCAARVWGLELCEYSDGFRSNWMLIQRGYWGSILAVFTSSRQRSIWLTMNVRHSSWLEDTNVAPVFAMGLLKAGSACASFAQPSVAWFTQYLK